MASIQILTVSSATGGIFSSWGILRNKFNLSIWSTAAWTATATVQRKFGSTGITRDVFRSSTNIETYGTEPEDEVYYRIGVKTTEYTSGKIRLRLSQ